VIIETVTLPIIGLAGLSPHPQEKSQHLRVIQIVVLATQGLLGLLAAIVHREQPAQTVTHQAEVIVKDNIY